MRLKVSPAGSATQATSKSTAVTIDNRCGQITLNAASLGATTSVSFTVNCAAVGAIDVVSCKIASGATAGSYTLNVDAVAAGSFRLHLRNVTAGALAEALVINYAIIGCFA